MSGILETLKRMQALDNRILALAEEKEVFAAERLKFEAECTAEEGALAAISAQTQEIQKKEKVRELDLKSLEERKTRLKAQLLTVKTNKEYSALQSEIRSVYADIEKMEESGLQELTAIDGLSTQVKDREAQAVAARERLAAQIAKETDAFVKIDGQISAIRAEWEQVIADVPAETIELYRRIAGGRDGIAVVPVDGSSCGGCYMNLPPQTINLLMGGEATVQCRSCHRILYLDPVEPVVKEEKKKRKKDAAS